MKQKYIRNIKLILLIIALCLLGYALQQRWELLVAKEIRKPLRLAAEHIQDHILEYLLHQFGQWLLEKITSIGTIKEITSKQANNKDKQITNRMVKTRKTAGKSLAVFYCFRKGAQ